MGLLNVTSHRACSLPCDDELRNIFGFIGDHKTISALQVTSKRLNVLVSQVQKARLRCFHLLAVIYEVDNAVCSLQYRNPTSLYCSGYPLIERKENSLPDESKADRVNRRIHPQFIQRCLFLFETLPDRLVGHVFTILKEDLIDALSEYPYEVLNSVTIPSYPSLISVPDEGMEKAEFVLDDIVEKAKKRECGDLFISHSTPLIVDRESKYYETEDTGDQSPFQSFNAGERYGVAVSVEILTSKPTVRYEDHLSCKPRFLKSKMHKYLPVSAFYGKEWGDVLEFTSNSSVFRLRIRRVEEVSMKDRILNILKRSFEAHVPESSYSPPLKVERQLEIKKEAYSSFIESLKEERLEEKMKKRSYIESIQLLD